MSSDRLLIWDFDGTLATRPEGWTGAIIEALAEGGFSDGVTREALRPHLQAGFPWHTPAVRIPKTPDQWWDDLSPVLLRAICLGAGLSEANAKAVLPGIRRWFAHTESWNLYDDSLPVLGALHEEGWRHVILSNHVPELPDIVRGLELFHVIEEVFCSASTGIENHARRPSN